MSERNLMYFHGDVVLTGKHARYVDALWQQNQINNSYFKRLVDLYAFAAIIGFRTNRKSNSDPDTEDKRTIQTQQLVNFSLLNDLMKLFLLLDKSMGSDEERVNKAFRGPKDEEEFNENVEMFNSYVRGGIEVLYEELALRELDLNDKYTDKKIGNLMALLENNFVEELWFVEKNSIHGA